MKIMIDFIFYKTTEDQPLTEVDSGMHRILEGGSFLFPQLNEWKWKTKKSNLKAYIARGLMQIRAEGGEGTQIIFCGVCDPRSETPTHI